MATALRAMLISTVVAMVVAVVTALALSWLLPSSMAPSWVVNAVAVGLGVTAGARAEGTGTSWRQAMARGCVAGLAAGAGVWFAKKR